MNYVNQLSKQMRIMLLCVGILFGAIFGYKFVMWMFMKHYLASHGAPTVTVSTTKANYAKWQPELKSVGNLRATLGVNVTAQLAGMIQTIYFTPGSVVEQGAILVQQNADPDKAQLQALQANAELAKITYERDKAQFKIKAVSKQQIDSDELNLKGLTAQAAQQSAIVDKLTIKAPFTGKLGISRINPGQYLNPGDAIVTLQRLDPIYVDFYLPQQMLSKIAINQDVIITSDAYPHINFTGKITTINPIVETDTRNVEVEATIDNPKGQLAPGMFTNVIVIAGKQASYLTVPQSAIAFNPYGEIVYIVKDNEQKGKQIKTVQQIFVKTGETRGDQIIVLDGLKAGDEIVTSGQIKLRNGSQIAVNNTVQPSDSANPKVTNNHKENS